MIEEEMKRLFHSRPGEYSASEIADRIGAKKNWVQKILKRWLNQGYVEYRLEQRSSIGAATRLWRMK